MNLRPIIIYLWIACIGSMILINAAIAQSDFERSPINYLDTEVHDPVARLAEQIDSGETKLTYDEQFGYLKSVLKALDVPVSSQSLVFSKTSLQLNRISPKNPRSLYFNDDVYVGYCQHGDVLEFAATDAKQGASFYTLKQSEKGVPKFVRDKGSCLTCHASSRTMNVPGYLIRSVFPDRSGQPRYGSGTFTTTQASDFNDRWGGWYVTGKHGEMRHMGNTICTGDEHDFDRESGANLDDLSDRIAPQKFLSPHSDIVALMVLEHQTQMHNAIAAANYETRQALYQSDKMNKLLDRPDGYVSDSAERRIATAANRVLTHLLMCDEFQLSDRVSGSTSFSEDFAERGKQDSRGRSLREFDLKSRLFKYPCSYLIHSDAFNGLPDEVREQIMLRLHDILKSRDDSGNFKHLSAEMRADLFDILCDTKAEFRQLAMASQSESSP